MFDVNLHVFLISFIVSPPTVNDRNRLRGLYFSAGFDLYPPVLSSERLFSCSER
jgi:hypothetical protein